MKMETLSRLWNDVEFLQGAIIFGAICYLFVMASNVAVIHAMKHLNGSLLRVTRLKGDEEGFKLAHSAIRCMEEQKPILGSICEFMKLLAGRLDGVVPKNPRPTIVKNPDGSTTVTAKVSHLPGRNEPTHQV